MARRTSKSVPPRLVAPTLIWIEISGCLSCCDNEAGAFGFSKERSLIYCVRTPSCGGAAASADTALVSVIDLSCNLVSGRLFGRGGGRGAAARGGGGRGGRAGGGAGGG